MLSIYDITIKFVITNQNIPKKVESNYLLKKNIKMTSLLEIMVFLAFS